MAIWHLANNYRYLTSLGHARHAQAWKSLQEDLYQQKKGQIPTEQIMLSLLLLGLSSVWHPGSNLGLQYLFVARNLAQQLLQEQDGARSVSGGLDEFFQNALLYWEMLFSFLDPSPKPSFPAYGIIPLKVPPRKARSLPHPWAGVAPDVEFAIAEVGRIIRLRQRQSPSQQSRYSGPQSPQLDDMRWMAYVEQYLLSLHIPEEADVLDYADATVRKVHLIKIARAQRLIGLLEIYKWFPDVLKERVSKGAALSELNLCAVEAEKLQQDAALTTIALHALDTVKSIPISSAACRALPLVLVSCASQLRFPSSGIETGSEIFPHHCDDVLRARYSVELRMSAHARKYPQRPLMIAIDIIKEVWARLDSGSDKAHWMDVAHERELSTLIG